VDDAVRVGQHLGLCLIQRYDIGFRLAVRYFIPLWVSKCQVDVR
jgi:hypothetical protein